MSQKRFTLLISVLVCQFNFHIVFVFGESEIQAEGKVLLSPIHCIYLGFASWLAI